MSLPSWARAASVHDSRDGAPSGNGAHRPRGARAVPVAGRKARGAGDDPSAGGVGTRGARSVEIVHGVLLVHCAECCIVSIGEQCFAKPTPVFRLC